jgi:hypothetical protein
MDPLWDHVYDLIDSFFFCVEFDVGFYLCSR